MSNHWFADRIVLVTGAASGMGEALIYALAERGVNVLALDQDYQALSVCCDAIEAKGGRVLGVPFDLLQFDQYDARINPCNIGFITAVFLPYITEVSGDFFQ